MAHSVGRIDEPAEQLGREEYEELLDRLAEHQVAEMDAWDQELERDSRSGGRLEAVMNRARSDIAAGRTKPLDDVIDNSIDFWQSYSRLSSETKKKAHKASS